MSHATNPNEKASDNPELMRIAALVRNKSKTDPQLMRSTILDLCRGRFLSVTDLATLLHRSAKGLRDRYIRKLAEEELLERRFPQQPNHEQ